MRTKVGKLKGAKVCQRNNLTGGALAKRIGHTFFSDWWTGAEDWGDNSNAYTCIQKKKSQSNQGKNSYVAALFINVSFNNKTKCEIASVILQKLKAKSPDKAISSYPNRQFRINLINCFSDHLETREKSREIRPSVEMTRNSLPR